MAFFSKKLFPLSLMLAALLCATPPQASFANEEEDVRFIELPAPSKDNAAPLMKALAERKSTRSFDTAPISNQDLSNILWAAYGINRDDGKRTIPTARNKQNVSVYVYMKGHIWIYDAEGNALHKLLATDLSKTAKGPLMLIYTAEGDAKSDAYGNMHTGSMYQNVGLYCAVANLGNVVHQSGKETVQEALAPFLPSAYTVRMLQSVGAMK